MNTKILLSLLTIGVASAGVGYGTYAFFSDTESSTGNVFTAGTLDLALGSPSSVGATIANANFAPGESVSGSLVLTNAGSIVSGLTLDMTGTVTVTDAPASSTDSDLGGPSNPDIDQYLVLTTLTYGSTDLLASIGDADGDGRANTLADLEHVGTLSGLAAPATTGTTLSMTVQFSTDGGNDLQGDSADLSLAFNLQQVAPAPPSA